MKKEIPTHDPYTGELNPHYQDLTGNENPYSISRLMEKQNNSNIEELKYKLTKYIQYSKGEINNTPITLSLTDI